MADRCYKKVVVASAIITLVLVLCLCEQAWLVEYYWLMELWGVGLCYANGFVGLIATAFALVCVLAGVYGAQWVWCWLTKEKTDG